VLTSLALAAGPAHMAGGWFAFGWIFFLAIPLFFLVIFAILATVGRRRWARGGWGPGHNGHGMGWGSPTRSAEASLAERFAQGDIDEKEYRARLEVLRASAPVPPTR